MGILEKLHDKIRNFDIKPRPPVDTDKLYNEANQMMRRSYFMKATEIYRRIAFIENNDSIAFNKYLELASLYDSKYNVHKFALLFLKQFPNDLRLLGLAAISSEDPESRKLYFEIMLDIRPNLSTPMYFCSLLNNNIPDRAPTSYIKGLFNNYANHYDHHLVQTLKYRAPEIMVSMLQKQRSTKDPFTNVLDACCGTGLFGKAFRIFFKVKNLSGVDISSNMIEQCKKKHIYNTVHVEDIITYLQNETASFDLISCIDSVNYFGNLTDIFSLTHAKLDPQGLFCFTLQVGKEYPYTADATGRFSHHKKYIKELAKDKFTIMKFTKGQARIELGKQCNYYFLILEKKP